MKDVARFIPGTTPVLISIPHAGTYIPPDMREAMTADAHALPDTDWHVDRLYDFASSFGVGLLVASHSRYVVDLNRDPAGTPLYPGADNTDVVPTTTFARAPIYLPGRAPAPEETERRIGEFWQPYHDRLGAEIGALRRRFGVAVLWDAHSIPSEVPRFFAGRLPDLKLGSAMRASADPELVRRIMARLGAAPPFSAVLDGRFTGGYITRQYGRPADGVHALQLEIAQIAYMDEAPPYRYEPARAEPLRRVLRDCVAALVHWTGDRAGA